MTAAPRPLTPNATVGILGGGQLGRMLAMAAAKIGLRAHIFSPDPHSPAFDVVHRTTIADYTDENALDQFAREVDVVTYEFENVPSATARFLAARVPVLPDPRALATTQDRLAEKSFLLDLGIPTARFAPARTFDELQHAVALLGGPGVLKTCRYGYDGKGQALVRHPKDAAAAWQAIGSAPAILETLVPFEREVSLLAARSAAGDVVCFDLTENEHRDHILKVSRVPAAVPDLLREEGRSIAERIAAALDYVGVLAVEMFVTVEEGRRGLLVNELAPRVHNSGHWTLDGCSVSQFEQHIRAVAGWPLGTPRRWGRVEMVNLIGEEAHDHLRFLGTPGASLHLYGKATAREGRKMGHVTTVTVDRAREQAMEGGAKPAGTDGL